VLSESVQTRKIERHRTAIVRRGLSRPVRLALEGGLFEEDTTFFDYGCGHGVDVKLISAHGYVSGGWDPYYFPENEIHPADIVNLGYVINVIECLQERREALLQAWALARKVLIVAARVLPVERGKGDLPYGDGIITSRDTFQKYYDQQELKNYIDSILGVDAIPVEPGICFVFCYENDAQTFRASRYRPIPPGAFGD
jgi:DNA phosphorothioation-associated putative methyltransferase